MNTKDLHQSLQNRVYEIFLENLIDDSEHNYEPGWVSLLGGRVGSSVGSTVGSVFNDC